jgi:hypothetical protein
VERLEHSDVKHVVYPGALRQLKAVRHWLNALGDLVRSSISWTELPTRAWHQRLGGTVQQAQPHPVADGELHSAMMNVVVLAGVFLCLEKTGAHLVKEGVTIGEEGVTASVCALPC